MNSFSDFLRSIGTEFTLSTIAKNLDEIKEEVERVKPDNLITAQTSIGSKITDLSNEINNLKQQLDAASDILTYYQDYEDKKLKKMIDTAEDFIINYKTAYDITVMYDKSWFSRLILTLEAKIQFAAALYDMVTKFTKDNTETLYLIANRDTDILNFIKFPVVEDE